MISLSLINYVGQMEDGVGVLLSLMIDDDIYEMIYWFNPMNDFRIIIEDKFYQHYPKIKDIYEYEYLFGLLYHIETNVLPSKEEIFKEFIKE